MFDGEWELDPRPLPPVIALARMREGTSRRSERYRFPGIVLELGCLTSLVLLRTGGIAA